MNLEKLKYPIGKLNFVKNPDNLMIKKWILSIKEFPKRINDEVIDLSNKELLFKYQPNGWTIKQDVAHCLDSHTNSFIRFKLALTEENPVIKPYREDKWAELSDTLHFSVKENLESIKHLHKRWVFLLESLTEKQLNRTFIHPNGNETISLKENLSIYAWHCEHHLQHIILAKKHQFI